MYWSHCCPSLGSGVALGFKVLDKTKNRCFDASYHRTVFVKGFPIPEDNVKTQRPTDVDPVFWCKNVSIKIFYLSSQPKILLIL